MLLFEEIEENLSKLHDLINQNPIKDSSERKTLDKNTLNKIGQNLNNLDKIIKELDENN